MQFAIPIMVRGQIADLLLHILYLSGGAVSADTDQDLDNIPSNAYLIINARVFDGESLLEHQSVLIDGERVVDLAEPSRCIAGDAEVYDLQGGTLLPGFIDLQVNGGGGVLFNAAPAVDTLRTIASAHWQYGTTGFLPTLISDSFDVMRRAARQTEPTSRRLYLEEAERQMLRNSPVIPIYFNVNKSMVSPSVSGWGDNVLNYHYSQHLSFR